MRVGWSVNEAAAVAVGALLFAACGDDDESTTDTGSDDSTAEPGTGQLGSGNTFGLHGNMDQ